MVDENSTIAWEKGAAQGTHSYSRRLPDNCSTIARNKIFTMNVDLPNFESQNISCRVSHEI